MNEIKGVKVGHGVRALWGSQLQTHAHSTTFMHGRSSLTENTQMLHYFCLIDTYNIPTKNDLTYRRTHTNTYTYNTSQSFDTPTC